MTTYTPERRAAMIAALTEKLKNLALAATPGPWACGTFPRLLIVQIEDGVPLKHTPIADIGEGTFPWDATSNSKQEYEDAAYIAAASPDAVIALIEEIERLRAAPSNLVNGLTEAETDESMSVRGLSQKAVPSYELPSIPWSKEAEMMEAWAAPSTSPWQPIETAPKDGTTVLLYPPSWTSRTSSTGSWNSDNHARKPAPYWQRDDCWNKVMLSRNSPTTHWMPLPAAPIKGGA